MNNTTQAATVQFCSCKYLHSGIYITLSRNGLVRVSQSPALTFAREI